MSELTTLARPYAKAVFKLASETQSVAEWSDVISTLASISVYPDVVALQENPTLSVDDIVGFYLDISGSALEQQKNNFLRLLASNKRLSLLPEILVLYKSFEAEQLQQIDVTVTSAFTLTSDQQQLFINKLKAKLGKEINLHCREDRSLVGGAVVSTGDKVIDGSIRGKLQQMAECLGT